MTHNSLICSSFIPLFTIFTIPYYSGIDCIGWLSWFQKKGWMEWTKKVGVDTEKLILRVENDEDFRIDTLVSSYLQVVT